MKDFSQTYLSLQRLMREYHEATTKNNFKKAYEISVDITDLAQKLEDVTKDMANAGKN